MTSDVFVERALRRVADGKIILDVGGGHPEKTYSKEISASLHQNLYISLNKSSVEQPDIIADCHYLPFKDRSINSVICKAVLEHVENPFQVVREIHRVLKKRGAAYFYLPFLYPYHPANHYQDFFRYTRDGVKVLLKNFSKVEINSHRGYFQTILRFLPRPLAIILKPGGILLDWMFPVANQTSGWDVLAIK